MTTYSNEVSHVFTGGHYYRQGNRQNYGQVQLTYRIAEVDGDIKHQFIIWEDSTYQVEPTIFEFETVEQARKAWANNLEILKKNKFRRDQSKAYIHAI